MSSSPLALLGGPPTFSQPLHVNRPTVTDRASFLSRVSDVLDSGWYTNDGPLVAELEERIAERLGVRHCIATCNGTAALGIAARGLRLTGEVILPSFTFVATAHALTWQGLRPVFCDIDEESWNLDPEHCESLVSAQTSAIVGVHLFGRACEVDALQAVAERHSLALMFDAAHAFGSTAAGRKIGAFGDAEVFSFHATKAFHTFEGGAITTNSDALAQRLRLLRNFGFTDFDQVALLGTNAKMPEVCAAMGLTNLENFEDTVAHNRRNRESYQRRICGLDGLRLRTHDRDQQNNWQYLVVSVHEPEFGLHRDELLAVLHADNILARRYFYPGCHLMEPYRTQLQPTPQALPHTSRAADEVLVLPSGRAVADREIGKICEVLQNAAAHAAQIRRALRSGEATA